MNVVEFSKLIALRGSDKLHINQIDIHVIDNLEGVYRNRPPEEILHMLEGAIPLLESQIKQLNERKAFLTEYYNHKNKPFPDLDKEQMLD
jgi:hypothetical protein